ncbi:U4/U6.U5 small nuclear ribonucleoprotein 27 kDa protein-like [Anopheles albimanus]|uniref:U4/U6.U5 small nuclear ribonucleoprotein 27 kDa protein-like n=1 Tax=Anopheles albimanus TaxID=7167 RepID=UPI001640758D|nr:U4/U6.U5 small nuclear ribonucleoprotein 27 kDa protein-like [Anopheles albimanus]
MYIYFEPEGINGKEHRKEDCARREAGRKPVLGYAVPDVLARTFPQRCLRLPSAERSASGRGAGSVPETAAVAKGSDQLGEIAYVHPSGKGIVNETVIEEGGSQDPDRERVRDRGEQCSSVASFERSSDKPMPSTSTRRAAQMKPMVSESELEGKTPEEQEMLKTMGFCGFDTTKGKKVEGNDVGEVHVILKRKYRQYMNRKGGFNRPLDFVA